MELLRASEGTPDQEASLDEVKGPYPADGLLHRRRRKRRGKSGAKASSTVVAQPLVPGLQVAYAIDSDRTIAYIPKDCVRAVESDYR